MGAYARWRALRPDQQGLAVKAFMAIAAALALIRLLGVARTLRIAARPVRLASLAQGRPARDQARTVIGDVVTAVDRAGRYVPGGTCLPKSLALAWMLRGMGIAAAVRIGVKTAGQFEAHAWVECDGVAVESVPLGYTVVPSLQSAVHSSEEP